MTYKHQQVSTGVEHTKVFAIITVTAQDNSDFLRKRSSPNSEGCYSACVHYVWLQVIDKQVCILSCVLKPSGCVDFNNFNIVSSYDTILMLSQRGPPREEYRCRIEWMYFSGSGRSSWNWMLWIFVWLRNAQLYNIII